MSPWLATVCVAAGGAAGSVSRYWLSRLIKAHLGADFPWATLAINLGGSFILGLAAGLFRDRASGGYLLLGVGFCGGLTTFSTFSLEVVEALDAGRADLAAAYVGASLAGGFAGFWLGRTLA